MTDLKQSKDQQKRRP